MPDVSVIISTYNRLQLLTQALRSARSQTDVELEIIVVDNGSTDGTSEYLAKQSDDRLTILRNETSLGSVGGRNTGLASATGNWVTLLDDDDLWAPDKLRAQLAAATAEQRCWAYTGCVHIDGSAGIRSGRRPPSPEDVMATLPFRFLVPGGMSNVVWRRGSLDADGLLDPSLPFPADWDISLRLSRVGPPSAVNRPLVGYRQHETNMSKRAAEFNTELRLLESKHADLRRGRPIDWGLQHRFTATEALRAGDRAGAASAFSRAIAAGDRGSLLRAGGLLLPSNAQRALHRRWLSDRGWLREAERWLRPYRMPEPSSPAGRASRITSR